MVQLNLNLTEHMYGMGLTQDVYFTCMQEWWRLTCSLKLLYVYPLDLFTTV